MPIKKYNIPIDSKENAAKRFEVANHETVNIDDDDSAFSNILCAFSEYASSKQINPKKVYTNPLVASF